MTIKTTISDAYGVVQTDNDSGFVMNSAQTVTQSAANTGFAPYQLAPMVANGTSYTATIPGLYYCSGTNGTGGMTITMPTPSAVPGGIFVMVQRATDPIFLTASSYTPGNQAFTTMSGSGLYDTATTTIGAKGSKMTLSGTVGFSYVLLSTGVNYLLLGASGSIHISGT